LGVLLLVGATLSTLSVPAPAEDSITTPSKATTTYAVGQQGHKLKWLPYRPSKPSLESRADRESSVNRTQYLAPSTAPPPETRTSPQSRPSPFSDPFGDARSEAMAQNDPLRSFPAEPPPAVPPEEFQPPFVAPQTVKPPVTTPQDLDTSFDDRYRGPSGFPNMELEECPSPGDEEFFTPIRKLSVDTKPKLTREGTEQELPQECQLQGGEYMPREWCQTTFTWKASGLCHKPLYFEDVQLERYGHSWGPYLQPIISGAHFFLTVPILPYKMGLYPPEECIYTLGYYRPGSCAPYLLDPLPLSVRAGLAQAGAMVGGAYVIP